MSSGRGAVLGALLALATVPACSALLDFSSDPGAPPQPDGLIARADGPGVPETPDAAIDAIALDASPYCRPGSNDLYDPVNKHCYLFLEEALPYAAAQTRCAATGGQLASITSPEEQALLLGHMKAAPYWIGLDDLAMEGVFVWASGEPLSFTNWRVGEPNDVNGGEDCAVMYGPYEGEFASYAGFWNDSLCPEGLWAVCELIQ